MLITGTLTWQATSNTYKSNSYAEAENKNLKLIRVIDKELLATIQKPGKRLSTHPNIITLLLGKSRPDNKEILAEILFTKKIQALPLST